MLHARYIYKQFAARFPDRAALIAMWSSKQESADLLFKQRLVRQVNAQAAQTQRGIILRQRTNYGL